MKILSFALAFITAVMLFPYGTLTAAADNEWFIDEEAQNESVMNEHNFTKQSEDDTSKHVEEETEFGEEFVYEWNDELKASEESKGGTSQSARSTQITTTGYIPDGVYAIRNVANQNYWMDVQNDSLYAESYIQQSSYSSNPADTFTRPALFKISRIPNTDRYVIRLMTNNRLSIYGTSDKEAATIKVSPRDTDVPVNNTFYITYDTNGYIIKPHQSPSYVLASQSTTHAGESSYPYSKLEFVPRIGSDSKARWQLYQYTGTQKCGILTSRAVSTGDGIPVGQSGSVWMYNWSTVIGANTPYMFVDPSCTSVGDVTWNNDTLDSTVTGLAAGDLKIRLQILYDDSQSPLYTAITNQVIIPDIAGDTAFVQNVGTGRYIDLEQVNYVPTDIVQQWSFHGGTQSQWVFELGGSGYFKIKSVKTEKYIGVDSSDTTKVKQYATVTDYTLWKLIETSSGNYKITCKASALSGKVLAAPSSTSANGADLTMLSYVSDSDYKDEWVTKEILPVSGSEIAYNTSLWNYQPVMGDTNCYAYSLNNQVIPGSNYLWYMQPGQSAGETLTTSNLNKDTVVDFVEKDANILGFTFCSIGKHEVCPNGTYKVALVISESPNKDYHWYRQNPDGTWSHKPGSGAVTNTDASGNIIFDPEFADRNYSYANYSMFVGFFKVTPLNNMYSPSRVVEPQISDTANLIQIDEDKIDLPSQENALMVCRGMRYSEVVSVIGHPQRVVAFGLTVVEYDLENGDTILVEYIKNNDGSYIVERVEIIQAEEK